LSVNQWKNLAQSGHFNSQRPETLKSPLSGALKPMVSDTSEWKLSYGKSTPPQQGIL
jgi:hypothetical protein